MKEKTSLERSHSGLSNFKLTIIVLLLAVFETIFWVVLACDEFMIDYAWAFYVLLIGSLVITLVFEFIAFNFKR